MNANRCVSPPQISPFQPLSLSLSLSLSLKPRRTTEGGGGRRRLLLSSHQPPPSSPFLSADRTKLPTVVTIELRRSSSIKSPRLICTDSPSQPILPLYPAGRRFNTPTIVNQRSRPNHHLPSICLRKGRLFRFRIDCCCARVSMLSSFCLPPKGLTWICGHGGSIRDI
ncbi:uncharacterized protein LOC131309431 [Rhododendron vialii]|uniref:uncharacterized protein LOC131309431 n=1 Tax=Rhododendron vialii TaxID=182163 RepID=UPI00265D791F|nr:uncharacterized protein LOC131309431 [Rhododendron vialii]